VAEPHTRVPGNTPKRCAPNTRSQTPPVNQPRTWVNAKDRIRMRSMPPGPPQYLRLGQVLARPGQAVRAGGAARDTRSGRRRDRGAAGSLIRANGIAGAVTGLGRLVTAVREVYAATRRTSSLEGGSRHPRGVRGLLAPSSANFPHESPIAPFEDRKRAATALFSALEGVIELSAARFCSCDGPPSYSTPSRQGLVRYEKLLVP
jgi:hypothetical protein